MAINEVVRHLLKHMQDIDETRTITLMEKLIVTGASPFWIADLCGILSGNMDLLRMQYLRLQTLFQSRYYGTVA